MDRVHAFTSGPAALERRLPYGSTGNTAPPRKSAPRELGRTRDAGAKVTVP